MGFGIVGGMAIQEWEYQVLEVETGIGWKDRLEAVLNGNGTDSWELVAAGNWGNLHILYLKRPKA